LLTGGQIGQALCGGFGSAGGQLLFSREFQLAVDIVDGFIQRHIAFARLALDGVGLRGEAVYTHNFMLGIDDGNLAALDRLSKLPSDN
jgi:hypothetical protein